MINLVFANEYEYNIDFFDKNLDNLSRKINLIEKNLNNREHIFIKILSEKFDFNKNQEEDLQNNKIREFTV